MIFAASKSPVVGNITSCKLTCVDDNILGVTDDHLRLCCCLISDGADVLSELAGSLRTRNKGNEANQYTGLQIKAKANDRKVSKDMVRED